MDLVETKQVRVKRDLLNIFFRKKKSKEIIFLEILELEDGNKFNSNAGEY